MDVPDVEPHGALQLTQRLGDVAAAAGVAAWGVTDAAPFYEVRHDMERRMSSDHHAGLTFTYNDPATATDVRRSLPWARSLFVAAWAYLPEAGDPGPERPETGRIARFATEDHYVGLRAALAPVAEELEAAGHRAEILSDDNRLVDRAAAVRAGVGWWGKNAMVLTPKHGPWLLLGSVATDAELQPTTPMQRDCGTCHACAPACPTGALDTPGVLDARLCLARWLQAKGSIPRELREAVGDRVYGCDDCLDSCPPGAKLAATTITVRGRVDLIDLLNRSDAELLERYDHFYIPKRNPNMIRRNALVALGNTGGDRATLTLRRYTRHASPVLRAHAVWALARLGSPEAIAMIDEMAQTETDAEVRAEIDHARTERAGRGA